MGKLGSALVWQGLAFVSPDVKMACWIIDLFVFASDTSHSVNVFAMYAGPNKSPYCVYTLTSLVRLTLRRP